MCYNVALKLNKFLTFSGMAGLTKIVNESSSGIGQGGEIMYLELKERLLSILRHEVSSDAMVALGEYAFLAKQITEEERSTLARRAYLLGHFSVLGDFLVLHPLLPTNKVEWRHYTKELIELGMALSPHFARGILSVLVVCSDQDQQINALTRLVFQHLGTEASEILREQIDTRNEAHRDLVFKVDTALQDRR